VNALGTLIMGLFAGIFTATAGALKDIRYEGFSRRKFIRSPIIAVIWAFLGLYAFIVQDYFVLLGFSAGMERLTVEIWKGFVRKKPSKFNSKNRDTGWIKEDAKKIP